MTYYKVGVFREAKVFAVREILDHNESDYLENTLIQIKFESVEKAEGWIKAAIEAFQHYPPISPEALLPSLEREVSSLWWMIINDALEFGAVYRPTSSE